MTCMDLRYSNKGNPGLSVETIYSIVAIKIWAFLKSTVLYLPKESLTEKVFCRGQSVSYKY